MDFVFDSIKIGLASPEQIKEWSYGVVEKPETINYRTQKPEKDGLFCEKIFGPAKDWECHCGKFKKIRFKGKICDKCGVEVTRAKVRRERMGHIELAAPVSHIWYFKGTPSRIGQVLEVTQKRLEEVLYFTKYIVIDPGNTGELVKCQLLTEKEFSDAVDKFGFGSFRAEMGAEAVLELLQEYDHDRYDMHKDSLYLRGKISYLDRDVCKKCPNDFKCNTCEYCNEVSEDWQNNIEFCCNNLKQDLKGLSSGQKKLKLLKRLEILEAFRTSGNKPEWMILRNLPVIPPELRPMVQLDGGRYATSDLNDLYRRVINRNNRMKKMLQLDAPNIIIRNEKRMLQEAVDALIDNGRRGRPVTGPNNRNLKSLSDMLKGKQGRFRQNLLGKRVDYSGRSVIVVGPELKMYQCGLPKEMAVELFKPFILKRLVDTKVIANIKSARKLVDKGTTEVWDALEHVIKDHPVLLNRAPTLHRLGIQAFEPVLVEGRALKLHPLVCTAYNADFDGDQMAVHLPLSAEAQSEARFLMLAANNLLKPSDGRPVAVPTQDMILGSYYLTMEKEGEIGEGKVFRDINEAIMAYNEGDVTLHAKIKVRMSKVIGGNIVSQIISCTVGRLIFNENIPQNLGYVDRSNPNNYFDLEIDFLVGKKQLSNIVEKCIAVHGTTTTSEILDKIKALGFKYSTRAAITVAVSDAVIPPTKKDILAKADEEINNITDYFNDGLISAEEKSQMTISVWSEATDQMKSTVKAQIKRDKYNPINMMADSGARGSENQILQLAGMRGLISNTSGATIEIPVRANYREGLNILEYFISSRGARKGLADTALRTADSGYLTRRLVDVSQEVIIREHDCGTDEGIEVYEIKNGSETIEKLAERLVGRYLVDTLFEENGDILVDNEHLMTPADAERIINAGITNVRIRSVLQCRAKHGICGKCYGANLANGLPTNIGEAVGVIAAQSIGEPGTQLTMRTFHTGGIASADDITQGLPRVEELFEGRKPKNAAIVARLSGTVRIEEVKALRNIIIAAPDGNEENYLVPYNFKIRVKEGQEVTKGQRLTEGNIWPADILSVLGPKAVQDYIIKEVQKVYRLQGVDINDKHIEVIIRQMMNRVRIEESGSSFILPGTLGDKKEIDAMNRDFQKRIENGEEVQLVEYTPIIQGITKASSSSDSFLSAASFQETTKALTDAAIRGKYDYLRGLKENVIIGNIIPAGTGLDIYNDIEVVTA
ncbi:MAG: DNA-directed RNA polymerase subunit beta' [Oscillospiraceae bacterium]|jgi:DNA-directed RNA polymerase subunit beta'|nr:DNA-directed RNA polymerase subunit beta' [Oscillospiraceae bacterium]